MAYPYVQARWYTRGAMVEARAILWHMAEGYGTVGYFTRTDRNVSSHYVIDRFGAITQMVRHADASHSAHWSHDADSSDASSCGGLYSPGDARDVLGADGIRDLNRYVIAVEVEGFRANGPNAAQLPAITELAFALFDRVPTIRGNLGHRDVQDYKACPGCKFPWDRIGGHGLFTGDDTMDVWSDSGVRSAEWPAGTPHYASPTATVPRGTLSSARRMLIVGRDRPDARRVLVDGAGDGAPGVMSWVELDKGTAFRDESYNAGVRDAAATAAKAVRP